MTDWEARVLEALKKEGGLVPLGRLAQAVHGSNSTVSQAAEELERKGLAKRWGARWRATELARNGEPDGAPATDDRSRRSSEVRAGLDYAIVLEDLQRRRSQLDAAIEAIEALA